mgnify:CR=1 FL=1
MTFGPWFPEPGSYIRYFDSDSKEYRYRRLLWRRDPLKYPFRFAAVAAGATGTSKDFDELNPSETKHHIYLAYLGLKPGCLFSLWHPYDIKNLKWDENIIDIDENLTAVLDYESSPYEYPTVSIGIAHDRYPAVEPKVNISGVTINPEVIWIASLYVVKEHNELSQDELLKLQNGSIRSYPWQFGGEL